MGSCSCTVQDVKANLATQPSRLFAMPHRVDVELPPSVPTTLTIQCNQTITTIKNLRQAAHLNQEVGDGRFGIIVDDVAECEIGSRKRKRFHVVDVSTNDVARSTLAAVQIPNVKDMYHVRISPMNDNTISDNDLQKSLTTCHKNKTAVRNLFDFLDPRSLKTEIGNSSVFERFLFSSNPHVNSFSHTKFSFSCTNVQDTQYLHVRGSPPSCDLSTFQKFHIVSSICLFSADLVISLCNQLLELYSSSPLNQTIEALLPYLQRPLTLNEADSISRLSNTIADVICTISSSASSTSSFDIILDIPRIQYYLSGPRSHFHIPLIAKTWLELVDCRKNQIERIFKKCIEIEIARRIGSRRLPAYRIIPTDGLDPILPLVKLNIGTLEGICTEECIDILTSSVPSWRVFFDYLPSPRPDKLEDLVFTSYVYELLTPFLSTITASKATTSDQSPFILQIDNIVESKPYLKAKRFLEVYSKLQRQKDRKNGPKGSAKDTAPATLIGMYPSERIFYSREQICRSSLHKYDPGTEFTDGDDAHAGVSKILARVYGERSIEGILEVASREGLL